MNDQIEKQSYLYKENQQIIEKYDDVEVVGTWAGINTITGEVTEGGKLMQRSVKFVDKNKSVHMDIMWYPDSE